MIFGVLTTVAAFAPMFFVPGPMGKMVMVIPMIVVLCLLFSLFESLSSCPPISAMAPRSTALRRTPSLSHGADSRIASPRASRASSTSATARCWTARSSGATSRPRCGHLHPAGDDRTARAAVGCASTSSPRWKAKPRSPTSRCPRAPPRTHRPTASSSSPTPPGASRPTSAAADLQAHLQTTVGQQPYKFKQAEGPAAFAAAWVKASNSARCWSRWCPPRSAT